MTLQARGVCFGYDERRALAGVDLSIEAGERLCLLGANGSGKSTLARLLNGLLVPDEGNVTVGDWDTREVAPSRIARRVAYVYQDPRRQVFLDSVADEIAFGPRNFGWRPEVIERAVDEALEVMDLSQARELHPYELTDSELRRVALASVLSMGTDFVILDEPTASLDARDMGLLLEALELLARRGSGVVVITHDMDFAAEHFPRAVLLSQGQVLADEAPAELFSREFLPGLRRPVASRTAVRLGLSPGLATGQAFVRALEGSQ